MECLRASPLLILLLCLSSAFFTTTTNAAESPFNLTEVLDKAGQLTMLIRLLNTTQVAVQLANELNYSQNSLTLFAPTDNAFNSLPTGFLNSLSQEQQIKLLNYHVISKFFVWDDFRTVSNPVITQASGPNGPYVLNFTFIANQQVNVSTGLLETTFSNALNLTKPVAVYQVDKVLLPVDKFSGSVAEPPSPTGKNATTPVSSASSPGSSSPAGSGANSVRREWGLKWSRLSLLLACTGLMM